MPKQEKQIRAMPMVTLVSSVMMLLLPQFVPRTFLGLGTRLQLYHHHHTILGIPAYLR